MNSISKLAAPAFLMLGSLTAIARNRVATERGLGLSDTPINAPDDKRRK